MKTEQEWDDIRATWSSDAEQRSAWIAKRIAATADGKRMAGQMPRGPMRMRRRTLARKWAAVVMAMVKS